ncbi:MAG: GAF domain-containing protein [Deltaproteobacteria bacterium]|nr:GAF domain-containing protein [Deltaproteobacteria bacterium]
MSEPSSIVDLSHDLQSLAALAADPSSTDDLLSRALDTLAEIVPYDLGAVLLLDGETLIVRCARGPLASAKVRAHRLPLAELPVVKGVLNSRQAVAVKAHDHEDEGDPYDGILDLPHGHSCMVVPLFAHDRSLGVMTFDRSECVAYDDDVVHWASIFGQIISLALFSAEQAHLLLRYQHQLKAENRVMKEAIAPIVDVTRGLEDSRSPRMQELVRLAKAVAKTESPVLIFGETGTGKEVLARSIQRWSTRKSAPSISLNCAALPEALIESELFGHVKGAFTGASTARDGRFLAANGGHLFLDEIGDLPLGAQAKLLRVLQEGTFEAVGSDRTIKVDVRIVAATHKNLEELTQKGLFREDLYFRLNVFPLHLPPLRERTEDLPMLAGNILHTIHARTGRGPWTLTQELLDELAQKTWRGNVRELQNELERATILTGAGHLHASALLPTSRNQENQANISRPSTNEDWVSLKENERRYIESVLVVTEGKIYGKEGAAERLDINPTTLVSRMKKLGIQGSRARRSPAKP